MKIRAEKPYSPAIKTPKAGVPVDTTPHTGVPRRQAPIPQEYQPLSLDTTPIYSDEREDELVRQRNGFDEEKNSRVPVNVRFYSSFFL